MKAIEIGDANGNECFQSLNAFSSGRCVWGTGTEKNFNVMVRYEDPIRNEHYPELVYWFVTPETIAGQHYVADIQHIAHDTAFDFPFLTARNGVNFLGRG